MPATTVTVTHKQLNDNHDVHLVVRAARRVSLTDEREAYYTFCTRMLAKLDGWDRDACDSQSLRTSMPAAIANKLTIPILHQFLDLNSDIQPLLGTAR
ncbi:hypothetical protein OHZ10_36165 [Burkholderia arboris]|uniref:Uncharacterized protein n=1 Tax=Burkholderia arboris TaxID=488730 RepID=A0ABZ3DUX8_9BURK